MCKFTIFGMLLGTVATAGCSEFSEHEAQSVHAMDVGAEDSTSEQSGEQAVTELRATYMGEPTFPSQTGGESPSSILEGFQVTPSPLLLEEGEVLTVTVEGTFQDGTTADITDKCEFSSDAPGVVIPLGAGAIGDVLALVEGSAELSVLCDPLDEVAVPVVVTGETEAPNIADLAVISFSYSDLDDLYTAGPDYTYSVTIENKGNTSSGIFWVDFWLDGGLSQPSGIGDMFDTLSLAAGESTELEFVTDEAPTEGAIWTSWVAVDVDDQVTESDETNNSDFIPVF